MFTYDFSDKLRKRLDKLGSRDKVLALIFKKKVEEVVNKDKHTINSYKNLKSPQNEYKRIHLTGSFVLLFIADLNRNHIVFVDIVHWDKAYS